MLHAYCALLPQCSVLNLTFHFPVWFFFDWTTSFYLWNTVSTQCSMLLVWNSNILDFTYMNATALDLWMHRNTHLFMSTVVTLKVTPFSHRTMKSRWENGQFPMLWPSLPAYTHIQRITAAFSKTVQPFFLTARNPIVPKMWMRVCSVNNECRRALRE